MNPYYQDDYITLYNADCRDILSNINIKNGFCFTDPPYNVKKNYKGWNDNMPDQEYLEFTETWINQIKNICSDISIYTPTKYFLDYYNFLGKDFKQIILTWNCAGTYSGGYINQFASILTNSYPNKRIKNWWDNCQMRGMGYFFKEYTYNHPGYTSKDITSKVVSNFIKKDMMIIEPFAGTGTILEIAKQY